MKMKKKILNWEHSHKRYITGESNEEVNYRVFPLLHHIIYSKLKIELHNTLIVSHKHPIRLIMKHFLKIPLDEFIDYKLPKKSIIHIKLDGDKNYLGHEYYPYDE